MTRVRVVVDQRHAFLRRIVGQAQDRDIGRVEEVGARGRILAPLGRDRDDLEVVAAGKPRPDLQAGRAVFAVDEDFRFHASRPEIEVHSRYAACRIHSGKPLIGCFSRSRRAFRSASRPR